MSELTVYNSERIYWAVEQVEQEAGDIDTLHLDDNLFYLKSDVDKLIEEKDEEIRGLKRALWTTRVAFAKSEKDRWNASVDCGNRRNRKDPAYIKTGKLLTTSEWREFWADVESKCRAKAELYKKEIHNGN